MPRTKKPVPSGLADAARAQPGDDATSTLGDRVYRSLSSAMTMGRLAPGQVLTIRALASAYRTSRMPVREALLKLAAQGALEVLDSGSVRMPTLSAARYHELTQARVLVESQAAAEAATHATPTDVKVVRELNERWERAMREGQLDAVLASNFELHFHVYRLARSDTLLRLIEILWMQAGPYVAKTLGIAMVARSQGSSDRKTTHRRLVDALASRDANAAREALAADIRGGFEMFESFERSLGASLSSFLGDAEGSRAALLDGAPAGRSRGSRRRSRGRG